MATAQTHGVFIYAVGLLYASLGFSLVSLAVIRTMFHESPDHQIERTRRTLRNILSFYQSPSSTIISCTAPPTSETT